jgi:hypothetical protein
MPTLGANPGSLKESNATNGEQTFFAFSFGTWQALPGFKFVDGTLFPEAEINAHRSPESDKIVYSGDAKRKPEPLLLETGVIIDSSVRGALNQAQVIQNILDAATQFRFGRTPGSILRWDLQQGFSKVAAETIRGSTGNFMLLKASIARTKNDPDFV